MEPAVLQALRDVSALRAIVEANAPGASPQGAELQKKLEESLAGVLQSLQGVVGAAARSDAAIDSELLAHISAAHASAAAGTPAAAAPSSHPDAFLLKQVQAVVDAHAVTVARAETLQQLVKGFDAHLDSIAASKGDSAAMQDS